MRNFQFWENVKKGPGCWDWTGPRLPTGYGIVYIRRHPFYAHRISWELANGRLIPDGLQICHHCDNESCVNPDHLFLGTQKENMEDMIKKGRGSLNQPHFGEQNGNSKLTTLEIHEIRETYKNAPRKIRIKRGALSEIARKYQITPTMVLLIVRNKFWKDI